MIIIDGKKIKDEILDGIKKEISALSFKPVFCDILVGEDAASLQYVEMKRKNAEALGIEFHRANFPASITMEDLIKEIKVLNKIPNMCGIIVQLPLPEGLDQKKILDAIDTDLDVDCLGSVASEKFYNGIDTMEIGLPTAFACIKLLDFINVDLTNRNIVVLGNGVLVGKPVASLLNLMGLKPIIMTSKSDNKEEIIKNADVIISGIGKGKFIRGDMIKDGVILIDAGTSESNGSIVGDIDFESVKDKAGFISPVPGGVGPVTIAMLFNNVLNVAKKKNER
ncbi:MAG: bifunctional 5,10-methylenetetrahydrofolate dehydrogenase/5,10-methenyltetrahydrofolate cyclohydrolase [Burkholderiales bacterium]|nr:bifunctional 5,10-methylenetetrahydrofolate dehydrogenase/5,10-methenyltetrahydrofolate cyclohydrolase [Burkholderiales bacterium]